jgi:hypothetical protein
MSDAYRYRRIQEYIIAKRQNVVPKNTAKANKAGANLLRAYLTEKIWKVTLNLSVPSEWPKHCHFYMDIRTTKTCVQIENCYTYLRCAYFLPSKRNGGGHDY